ncbi:hypothetical protein [Leisingera sp. ANG-M6]|uniref:hypothetical protein n=1 Tax=Leisingera sp. ANG-M6 TaxID=1577900 RepID=UPI00057DD5DB|nr:hypothetical protein [Leisingera sp. ANG-M6]KIC30045.1 hypothetical protein RA24_03625 [Leisingera sp. ANG-M6]
MFFTTALDDSSFVAIRRSILFYAALIVVVLYFDLSIAPPEKVLGIFDISRQVGVSKSWILCSAMLAQCYLLWRLRVAKPIAAVKLVKAWGLEELQGGDNFLTSAKKISEIVQRSGEIEYPNKQIDYEVRQEVRELADKFTYHKEAVDGFKGAISQAKNESAATKRFLVDWKAQYRKVQERIHVKYGDSVELADGKYVHDYEKWEGDSLSQSITDYADYIDAFLHSKGRDEFSEAASQAEDYLKRFSVDLKEFEKILARFEEHIQYCKEFPALFEVSDLSKIIQGLQVELAKTKDLRESEFLLFEIRIPTAISVASIVAAILGMIASWVPFDRVVQCLTLHCV